LLESGLIREEAFILSFSLPKPKSAGAESGKSTVYLAALAFILYSRS